MLDKISERNCFSFNCGYFSLNFIVCHKDTSKMVFRIKTLVVCLLWITSFSSALAQNPSCHCLQNLDSVTNHIRPNYPGYSLKLNQRGDHQKFLDSCRKEAETQTTLKSCSKLLNHYLAWFRDGHLGVSYSGDVFKPKNNRTQNEPVWEGLTEEVARKYLDSVGNTDPFEGIWESYESFYRALIRKNPNGIGYKAYLIHTINQNWKPGEVKMRFDPDAKGKLACTFYASNHSAEHPSFKLNRNILDIKKATVWNRIYPKIENPLSFESFVSAKYKWTEEFKSWSDDVFYIQLQNLNAGVKPLIDSLVKVHDIAIRSSKILFLDLRDNEGGDFTTFEALWPYVLTGPTVLYGTSYLCTPANIIQYKHQLNELEGQVDPEFQKFAAEMEDHSGENWRIENDTIFPETVNLKPEKVILLINQKCKSSTEDFILACRQSKKVVLAGTRTGGVADFEEVVDVPLPCPSLILYHPIGISNRLPSMPLDGIGIEPEITLKPSKAPQIWVNQVLKKVRIK